MAAYRASFECGLDQAAAFEYLADFSNAAEWDPGVEEAAKLTEGPVATGTRFRLVVSFLGRKMPLEYRIANLKTPSMVVFETETSSFAGRDTITVTPTPRGSRIAYDATLRLKGLMRLADAGLALVFRRTGDRALAGLKEQLDRLARRRTA